MTQTLADGWLPVPSSVWRAADLVLATTAFAASGAVGPVLYARYRVENAGEARRAVRLFVALRPFQVTPAWQRFGAFGGVSPIRELALAGGAVLVDGRKAVLPLAEPTGFGAAAFEEGGITESLRAGELPREERVRDDFGYASGALRFDLALEPGSAREVFLAIPFGAPGRSSEGRAELAPGPEALEGALRRWRTKLGRRRDRAPPRGRGRSADLEDGGRAHPPLP